MTADRSVRILRTAGELAHAVALHVLQTIESALDERSVAVVVLAGGETPRRAYEFIPAHTRTAGIDWTRVHFLFSDERIVPPDHPESNYGMAKRAFLAELPIPEENVHRVRGELSADEAATRYEADVRALFHPNDVRCDLTLLGLGSDGHTASLFPGTGADAVEDRIAIPVHPANSAHSRVSLSLPVLNASREVLMLVSGKSKATVVRRLLTAKENALPLPAAMISPRAGRLTWMLDADAASEFLP